MTMYNVLELAYAEMPAQSDSCIVVIVSTLVALISLDCGYADNSPFVHSCVAKVWLFPSDVSNGHNILKMSGLLPIKIPLFPKDVYV